MTVETVGLNSADHWNSAGDCIDTYCDSSDATGNFDAGDTLDMFPGFGTDTTLIGFPGLSNISSSATVTSATVYAWWYQGFGTIPTISFHECLRDFVETQATWNIWKTSNSWTTAGGKSDGNDRNSTVLATWTPSVDDTDYQSVTSSGINGQVEDWIDGTDTNNGFLWDGGAAGDGIGCRDSNYATDGERPYLSVDFETGGAAFPLEILSSIQRRNRLPNLAM